MILDTNRFIVIGNNASLDLINTEIVEGGKPKDLLLSFEDFAAWMAAANLVEPVQAKQFVEQWTGTDEAKRFFADVKEFRRILREMVEAVKNGETPKAAVVKAINKQLRSGRGYAELKQTDERFEKRFRSEFDEPGQLLAPVAEAAADLLCYGDASRLKKCAGATCVLRFYDTTKNRTRRWCSNKGCGNRAKAAAFYARKKAKSGTIG